MILGTKNRQWIAHYSLENSATKLDDMLNVTYPIVIDIKAYRKAQRQAKMRKFVCNFVCVTSMFISMLMFFASMLVMGSIL